MKNKNIKIQHLAFINIGLDEEKFIDQARLSKSK